MLYTVRPLERIYHNFNQEPKDQLDGNVEYKEFPIPSGIVIARRDEDKYIVDHIISTDMTDYLLDKYQPGIQIL